MAECTRAAADICSIVEPTVMTVFSNEWILRGRSPGACLADDVFFVAPEMDRLDRLEYWSAYHRKALGAYRHGLYDFGTLESSGNYVADEPNFYRDVTAFVLDARSLVPGAPGRQDDPFETSVVPTVPMTSAYVLSQLHFDIQIHEEEFYIKCTSRLSGSIVDSALSEIFNRLESLKA
jgi:hypothetical protein